MSDLSPADAQKFFEILGTIAVMNAGALVTAAVAMVRSHYKKKADINEAFRQIRLVLKRVYALEEQQSERTHTMKSFVAHYQNKYPGGSVDYTETTLVAYDYKGRKRVSLAIGGNGELVDRSQETGSLDQHCLSPIPKNSRAFKLHKDNRLGPSEEYQERIVAAKSIAVDGKVLAIAEYSTHVDFVVTGENVAKKETPAVAE